MLKQAFSISSPNKESHAVDYKIRESEADLWGRKIPRATTKKANMKQSEMAWCRGVVGEMIQNTLHTCVKYSNNFKIS